MRRQHWHGATAAQCSSTCNQHKVCQAFKSMLLADLLPTKRLQLHSNFEPLATPMLFDMQATSILDSR